jgi:hypothetical protein
MFGLGLYNNPANIGTVCLATSSYRCPAVFEQIAADLSGPRLYRERHSLNVDAAPQYGLDFETLADANLFWSVQDYTHEKIYDLAQRTRSAYGVMLYEQTYADRYEQVRQWQIDQYGEVIDPNVDCHGMTEVHIQTYRTAHYLLSCAQDYRAGKPGYQQHPWQATLGIDAVCFTNHPGSDDLEARPNFWAGNGILPRAVQHENVLVCLHHLPPDDAFPYSHAYLPQAAFDEMIERDGWVFARKDGGYLALYSQTPLRWLPDDSGAVVEARAEALDNIWLVEMGDSARWGSFAAFVEAIAATSVACEGLALRYQSPTQGTVEFAWQGPLRINGSIVALHDYPRFDNPYCQTDFGSTRYEIAAAGDSHLIDFGEATAF